MKTSKLLLLSVFSLGLFLYGCGTSVKRIDVNDVKDLSGRWNDTDSRFVAEEMIKDCLSRNWLADATFKYRKEPVVTVGTVRNQSSEHINTDAFVEDLQRALINSGQVDFVASKVERGEIRDERLEQEEYSSDETRKQHGQEIGADYIMSGIVNSINDQEGGEVVVFYQVNLKLIEVETNKIVWNGQKKLKKFVKRSKRSW
jgi:penicillin-binding protein activator